MKSHRFTPLVSMTIKYTYLRSGSFQFQRAYPKDLLDRYEGRNHKQNLRTSDPAKAARDAARINATLEAEWAYLRANPSASPSSIKANAESLLKDWGLSPKGKGRNDEDAVDAFRDYIEGRANVPVDFIDHGDYVEQVPGIRVEDHLRPVDRQALELLVRGHQPTLRDALDFYLDRHKKGKDEKFQKNPRLAVDQLIDCIGDKPLVDISRDDVNLWMVRSVEKGQTGGTIDRRLNALAAIVAKFLREKELDIPNRFEKHDIPPNAKPAKQRETFTKEELEKTQKACIQSDDDIRWLVAMLSDTCSRIAEVAGLRLEDINLDDKVPHINIVAYAGRSLKTNEISERSVPLVGVALWAAQRIKDTATKGQTYAFPRYIKDGKCQADLASATLNKWIRSLGVNHTTHEFRHTMNDRLREVECPQDIRKQIGGWSVVDDEEAYGKGFALAQRQKWLLKTILPSVVIPNL